MAEDITPELLNSIQKDFSARVASNGRIKSLLKKLESGEATYVEANKYAIEVGNCLAKTFKVKLSSAVLPNGRMYYNIASEILQNTLSNNHEMVIEYAEGVQNLLNQNNGIGIKAKRPNINQERIDGLIDRVSNEEFYDDIAWILDDPVINFTQNSCTETLKTNAELLSDAGIRSTISRIVVGKSCEWCEEKAGTYNYGDVPDDFYAQHENCRCMIIYDGVKSNRARGSRMTVG